MTRIDHAARSDRRMELALGSYETGEDAGAIGVALAALNDATLAMVEQQRIANLIALATLRDDQGGETSASHAAWDTLMEDDPAPLRPEIAAALGIENAS